MVRLDRYLASAAGLTRAEAKKALRAGEVRVNGAAETDGSLQVEEGAEVSLGGRRLLYRRVLYVMMNKPAGVLSSTDDPKGPTVLDLLPEELRKAGLFPAGRLDKDVTGLLLLTSDGEYCHRVISPKSGVPKRYLARTEGALLPEHRDAFSRGIRLEDGTVCLPAGLEILSSGPESECVVTVREGKYHQVKRMLAACSCPVKTLERLSIGALDLDPGLPPGGYRLLEPGEAALVFRKR